MPEPAGDGHAERVALEHIGYPTGYTIPVDFGEHLERARLPEEQGDERALEAFLLRIYWPVRRAIAARFRGMPSEDEASRDVTQDVMLHVLSHLDACRGRAAREVWSWIWRITENAGTDYLRTRLPGLAGRLFVEEFEWATGLDSWRSWREWADDQPSSGDVVLIRVIMEAYEQMPDRTAELIWYRIVAHSTYTELAELFNTTREAARRRWQRARAFLRKWAIEVLDSMPPGPEREAARAALEDRVLPGSGDQE